MRPDRSESTSGLLTRLLGPRRPEVTCDECFALLDRYVDLELDDAQPEGALPGMEAHLEGCPACREEHDLLLAYARDRDR
jgi:anti-sigma factor RsiW